MIKQLIYTATFIISALYSLTGAAQTLPINNIQLPSGFHISIYANNIENARQMALGDNGIVYVGSMAGKVYALVPNQNKTQANQVITIASGLNHPNGVAFKDGNLYVAEIDRILEYKNIGQHLNNPPKPQVIYDKLPDKKHHGYRYIKFSPDDWLYMGVGAPCNVCLNADPIFGSIVRMKPDGQDLQIYAKGVRNSVGFAWDPKTNILWFTDNGRDMLGDNRPPDELNKADKAGMHFGFPYVYGDNQPDPEFGSKANNQTFTPPAQELGPHVASLGMVFYTGKMFPKQYQDQIFIAEHGSWNRSKKIGYRISLVTLKNGKPVSYQPFATGWLQGQTFWGRPVDLLVMPDGSLLVSDDYAGVVYRISYQDYKP